MIDKLEQMSRAFLLTRPQLETETKSDFVSPERSDRQSVKRVLLSPLSHELLLLQASDVSRDYVTRLDRIFDHLGTPSV